MVLGFVVSKADRHPCPDCCLLGGQAVNKQANKYLITTPWGCGEEIP